MSDRKNNDHALDGWFEGEWRQEFPVTFRGNVRSDEHNLQMLMKLLVNRHHTCTLFTHKNHVQCTKACEIVKEAIARLESDNWLADDLYIPLALGIADSINLGPALSIDSIFPGLMECPEYFWHILEASRRQQDEILESPAFLAYKSMRMELLASALRVAYPDLESQLFPNELMHELAALDRRPSYSDLEDF